MFSRTTFLLAMLFLFCTGNAAAQSVEEEKERAVVEIGGAAFRSVTGDGANSFGPSVAVEITPAKNWLELEFGTTALFRRHSTEWGTDLLFKKPWDISPKVEFMFGIGPEWDHSNQFGIKNQFRERRSRRRFYVLALSQAQIRLVLEPTHEYSFARGHEQSIGITGGLLISIP